MQVLENGHMPISHSHVMIAMGEGGRILVAVGTLLFTHPDGECSALC